MRTVMCHAVAFAFALAAILILSAFLATMGWPESRFVEGVVATLMYIAVRDSEWLRNQIDAWWFF